MDLKKPCFSLSLILLLSSCVQSLEPTMDNINRIYESKDFYILMEAEGMNDLKVNFVQDYIVYQESGETIRREIRISEIDEFNQFIQYIYNNQTKTTDPVATFTIGNTAIKTVLLPAKGKNEFIYLLKKLSLKIQPRARE